MADAVAEKKEVDFLGKLMDSPWATFIGDQAKVLIGAQTTKLATKIAKPSVLADEAAPSYSGTASQPGAVAASMGAFGSMNPLLIGGVLVAALVAFMALRK